MRTAGFVTALAAVAVSSTVLYLASDRDAEPAEIAVASGNGYFATFARLTGTGADGRRVYDLTADRITQSAAGGDVGLERVRVNYAPPASEPWSLVADTGRITAQTDIIELNGNVVAATADAEQPATTIRTEFLKYDPGKGVAETDQPVTILYANGVVHARGLRARLREGRLELLAQVHGRYDRRMDR